MSPDEELVETAFGTANLGITLSIIARLFDIANVRAAPKNKRTANTAQTSRSPATENHSNSNVQTISPK